jgi:hypothetical protein
MNMDGASGSQLRTRQSGLLNAEVMFPREMMGYIWTRLQARLKGLGDRSDDVEDVTALLS